MHPHDMTSIAIAITGILCFGSAALFFPAFVGGAEIIYAIITRPWL